MANSQAEERRVIKIGGDEIDLSKLPPLTIGHKRRFFKESGLDLSNIATFNPEQEFSFVLFFLRQARPATTEQEVDDLSLTALLDVILGVISASKEADRPT